MALFCLHPDKVEEFKKALKNKDISLADLINLDHDALVKKLEPYAGDQAKQIATTIEEKLILKNRTLGLKNALSKMTASGKYSPEAIAENAKILSEFRAKQQERIFSPKEHESYLGGIVEKKLGVAVSREEAGKIFDLNTEIKNLKTTAKDAPLGTTPELLNKQKELSDYVNSLNQKSAWVSIRDSLSSLYKNLFIGVKTGIKTTALGTLNSIGEVFTRRVSAVKAIGDVDIAAKAQAVIDNIKMYGKTGSNTFIMTSLDDNSVFGESKGGFSENFGSKDTIKPGTTIAGKTAVVAAKGLNLAARAEKYLAINVLHKAPMAVTASMNFVDAADITSSQLAKMPIANGMDANAIFKDALKIEPETDTGKIVRLRSQEDMFRVLNINNTPLSDLAIALQKKMNGFIPTLGNYIIPMAKVPSSVIYNQLENFGGGFATGTYDIIKGVGDLRQLKDLGKEATPEATQAVFRIKNGVNTLIRTVGTIATAVIITQNLKKKEFYTDNYGNSYVKMGKYWLSTDAFGSAGPAVAGAMMARTDKKGNIFAYGTAGYDALGKSPVVDSINSIIQKGKQGKLTTGIINAYLNPILAQDIEKSVKVKSANPVLFGSLIRTEQQKIQQDREARLKNK